MSDQPRRYRFLIEAILFLTYAVFGMSWIAVTPLKAQIAADFQIGTTQFALINTLVSFAKIIAPLLTGLLAVRFGIKKTILFGSFLIACAAIAPLAPDFNLFLASRFVFGIGGAVVVTMLSAAVMQWFPKNELPVVNGFNNVAVNTGITATLFLTVPLTTALGGDWRKPLLVYGAISIGLLLAWAFLGREVKVEAKAQAASEDRASYWDIWRMKETWLISLIFSGPLALYLALNTFLPAYYMDAFHMTAQQASSYTGMFNLIGIPTAITAGLLTMKLGLRKPFILVTGALIGFAAFGMISFNSPVVILAAAVLLGVCLFGASSPLVTLAMELPGMTPKRMSLLMGTMFSFAYVISSISPLVVGALFERTHSYFPGFAIWASFSWVVFFAGLFLPETGPKGKPALAPKPASAELATA